MYESSHGNNRNEFTYTLRKLCERRFCTLVIVGIKDLNFTDYC